MYWRKVSKEARKLGVISFKGLISEVSALQTCNYFLKKIVTWLPQGLTSPLETFKERISLLNDLLSSSKDICFRKESWPTSNHPFDVALLKASILL